MLHPISMDRAHDPCVDKLSSMASSVEASDAYGDMDRQRWVTRIANKCGFKYFRTDHMRSKARRYPVLTRHYRLTMQDWQTLRAEPNSWGVLSQRFK